MGRTPVEDIQKSFSGQVDAHRYEEGIDKQAENQTELPEETNLLLLVDLCLNHTQCDKTTIFATNWCAPSIPHAESLRTREYSIYFFQRAVTGSRLLEYVLRF